MKILLTILVIISTVFMLTGCEMVGDFVLGPTHDLNLEIEGIGVVEVNLRNEEFNEIVENEGEYEFLEGDVVELNVQDGDFVRWEDETGAIWGSDREIDLTMNSDYKLVAVFE